MLTEYQKLKLVLDYCENQNYSLVARLNRVSVAAVRRAVSENETLFRLLSERFKDNALSVGKYLKQKKKDILSIIERCMDILNDDEKLKSATLPQLVSCMTSLIDSFADESNDCDAWQCDDPLSASLKELGEALKSDR